MELRDYQISAINNVHKAWAQGYKRPCVVMPCGAGKSVTVAEMAKRTTLNGKQVLFLVHRQELCEQIYNTFCDYGVDMTKCEVGMVQTVSRRLERMLKPSLIITDENHHCLAASYRKIYDRWSDVHCVGVTATPVRLNGGGLGEVNDKLIIGPTVRQLIERKCLADFDYYAPPVSDLSGLKAKRSGDFTPEDIEKALNKPKIYGDVISYYRQLAQDKQAICYCATINHSRTMAEEFNRSGISAAHIDGDTPSARRSEIIQQFRRGELKILCNVDLISEGFDVPDCAASILMRPTKSLTLYIQQAMRSMRYKEGKRAIIIDHVGNVHRFGLPDQEFEWSLEPARKRPSKKAEEAAEVNVLQCPKCFFTHKPDRECPNCGYVYPVKEHKEIETKEARLERITETVRHYSQPKQCRNRAELAAFGKLKGYKPGWAYYAAKEIGLRK